MPSRPFPFALSIGTDIAHATRFRNIILKGEGLARTTNLHRFLNRFLSWREQKLFWKTFEGTGDVFGPELDRVTRFLAGRWAAKEAVIKAVQYRHLSFLHVQILPSRPELKSGPVYALILDKPASAWDHRKGLKDSRIVLREALRSDGMDVPDLDSSATDELEENRVVGQAPTDDFVPAAMQDDELEGQVAKVSISHDGEYVTAVCLAAEEPREGDVGGEAAAREP